MQKQFACPQPQQTGQVSYTQVYWRHFWNAQRMTRTHLFAYREQGYATRSPEEGKTLCGESIPSYYHTIEGASDVCKRCKRIADKAQAK